MAKALELSRERYARLRAPDWAPVPLIVPSSLGEHTIIEHAAAALSIYSGVSCAVRVVLSDGSSHQGWIETVYTVSDPDEDGEGTRGAALLVPAEGDGVAFDLAYVRQVEECIELSDRI